jgi:ribonuclease E
MASIDDQHTDASPAGGAQAPSAQDAPATAAAEQPADPGTEQPTAKPARKRASRRATSKAATPARRSDAAADTEAAPAPSSAEPSGGAAAGDAPADGPAAEAAAPRKRATRKRATKAATKAAPKAPEAEAEPELPVTETAATGTAATGTAEKPTAAAAEESAAVESATDEPATDTTEESGDAAPAAAGFGLLFQAPEPVAPSRRRSRRATKDEDDVAAEAPAAESEEQPAEESGQGDEGGDEQAEGGRGRRRRSRGGKGRRGRGSSTDEQGESSSGDEAAKGADAEAGSEKGSGGEAAEPAEPGEGEGGSRRRTRRRRRSGSAADGDDAPGVVTRVREPRKERDEPQSVKGSTRLEAKKQRRREGREAGRRRTIITEAEFLARRESVERTMVVRERDGRTQIGVLEDGVLVEHYVSRESNASMAGNVYLGRVQNVLPSMEAAFVDIGKGRNAVLYAGEVNWDAAGLESNQPKRIENALKSGDTVLVQVTKDPIGHKGARLTSQVSLPGRYLVYVPEGSMTGISRKLPDTERARLKQILKEVVPESAGVIVRTAAEGASEEELRADVERLTKTWERIRSKADAKSGSKAKSGGAPALVHGEPDLTVRVIRDVFNEDFTSLVVAGEQAWSEVSDYINDVAPDLAGRLKKWTSEEDLFTHHRVDEQIAKAMDRKVWLPSGGSLVIDRTEAMTVVDVNTGKFVGSGGNLEETVTKNNIEAAEEIVRQLRLRDIGGIIVIDFIDMVLESNRDLVVRRLLECLGRDRTKHQVAEVTSLGLVQMTRKRVGSGLIEVFSESCEHCNGRGIIVHTDPVEKPSGGGDSQPQQQRSRSRRGRGGGAGEQAPQAEKQQEAPAASPSGPTPAQIAAAAHAAALKSAAGHGPVPSEGQAGEAPPQEEPVLEATAQEPATATGAGPTAEAAPAVATPSVEPQAPVAAEAPTTPRRRRRGRVVAPAGPPKAVEAHEADTSAEAAPATTA